MLCFKGNGGLRVLSFQESERTKEKPILSVSRLRFFVQTFLGSYIREVTLLSYAACLAQSQRRFLLPLFMAHANYNLT